MAHLKNNALDAIVSKVSDAVRNLIGRKDMWRCTDDRVDDCLDVWRCRCCYVAAALKSWFKTLM